MTRPLLAALGVAALACLAAPAVAAGPAVCDDTAVPPAPVTPYFEYPPRRLELWASASELGDWISHGTMAPALTLGVEAGIPFDALQGSRLGVKVDAVIGHWGGDDSSLFGLETGLAYRQTFQMDDLFDWYVLVRPVDVLLAFANSEVAYRPGLGVGLRVVRGVQLEGTADAVVGLGRSGGGGDKAGPGLTLSLGVDLCLAFSFCTRSSPPSAVQKNLTCNLYEEAQALCSPRIDRAALCNAVAVAMDASRPLDGDGAQLRDPIDAYLLAVEQQVNGPLKTAIDHLRDRNAGLLKRLSTSQEAERKAAQGGGSLVDHCAYSPTASELRTAFGCDAQGTPLSTCAPLPECR